MGSHISGDVPVLHLLPLVIGHSYDSCTEECYDCDSFLEQHVKHVSTVKSDLKPHGMIAAQTAKAFYR